MNIEIYDDLLVISEYLWAIEAQPTPATGEPLTDLINEEQEIFIW